MKTMMATLVMGAGLLSATSAQADIGIAGEVGTTGIGFHASIPLSTQVYARVGYSYLGYLYSGNTTTLHYDLKLKARVWDALIDYYPKPGGTFRISAGLAYNGNKIDARGKPNASGFYNVRGNSYSVSEVGTVTGSVDFGKVSPYLGIGWSTGTREKGWSFSSDIGVLFQGSPRTTLGTTGCTASAAICNQFKADVARESSALNDEASKFKVYPVLRIGLNYRF